MQNLYNFISCRGVRANATLKMLPAFLGNPEKFDRSYMQLCNHAKSLQLHIMQRCQSGRMCTLGKRVWSKATSGSNPDLCAKNEHLNFKCFFVVENALILIKGFEHYWAPENLISSFWERALSTNMFVRIKQKALLCAFSIY